MTRPGPPFVADPRAMVPYHDPHDDTDSTHLLKCFHEENPCLADIYDPPSHQNSVDPIPVSSTVVDEPSDPSDPIQRSEITDAAGSSNNHGESGNLQKENFVLDNGTVLSYSPVPSEPFNCSCCHLLRAITHTNGSKTTRLEIHGQIGTISHAILFKPIKNYQKFDFCKKSIEGVKQFLIQYLEERHREGYVVQLDPLAEFYDALSVGIGRVDGLDDFFKLSIASSASDNEEVRARANRRRPGPSNRGRRRYRPPRSGISLSEQRERTRKMTILDLAAYFYLPIEDAAGRLKTCPTVLKRICRRHGIDRWPHRKIKCIDGKISKLERKYRESGTTASERRSVKVEIKKEQQEIAEICFGVPRAPPCRRSRKK